MKKRGLSRRLLSVLLALVMLLSLLPTAVFAADPTPQTYKKVTQAPEDWSGTYLIVSEGDEAAFDSSLTKIDVSNNYKTVKIAEGTIKTTETIAVTIEKMADGNYSIKGANGKYIYQTSDANGLKTGAKATANTIALNADGTVDIVSGGAHLRFNKNSDQMRFRYFKSATYTRQQAITLYKLDAAPARQSGIVTDLTTLRDGDKVVVFNPSVKKAMSATAVATYYRAGVDVTLDSANKLTGYGDTELWTLGIKDGKYTFTTADGKKLSMGASYFSIPLDDVNTEWTITSAATEGCFYIKNVVRGNALQWYADKGNFSSKASISTTDEALFAQQFYLVIDSGSETPDPEPTFVPISTALAGAANTEFTVKGVVTLVDGQNIYLQDATGGICLRLGSKTSEIALGDTIYGTGKRAEYNKLPQLGSGTFKKSSGLTLTAKATTIGALTDKDVCGYVKLKGLEITEIYDNNGKYTSPNVTLKDADGKTIQLYKAVMEKKDGKWAFAVGDMVDVTAAVSTFNGTLQLRNTLADEIRAAGTIVDPISDDMIPAGAITVKEAGAITAKTENITVVGQVVYHYGNAYNGAASINSIILEDVIDGEIYGFQVYDYTNYAKYKVGDVVKITGTVEPYGGVPQMKSPTMEVIQAGLEPIPAQEITVSQMGKDYLSEYIYIKDVTLGTYNASGNTTVKDATGTVNLYKGVPLPSGAKEADVTGVYGCCSAYKTTYQLRNGASADYVTNVAPSGGLPTVGDQVVIYNANAGAALAKQDDNAESPSITKAAATIADGKLTTGNGAAVFTVEANGEYLRFYNESYGYLCANGTGNNAFYSKTASNDADWLVRTCSGGVGGYEMESRTAKYKGYSQWLEYYSDSFKVYSMNKATVTDYTIYSFDFYPVAESVNVIDGIVNAPCIVLGTLPPAYVGQDYELSFFVDAPFGVNGELSARLSDKSLNVTKGEDGKYSVTIPKAMISGDKLTVVITGKDNKGVDISSKVEIDVVDAPSIANPLPAERSETGDNKRPTIGATIVNAGNEPTIELTVNEKAVKATYENGKVSYTPAEDMADGRVNVQLTVTRKDGKSTTLSWYFIVGKAQYQLYFGQLHSHTQYSDGSGTLDSALDYVKNLPESANVQFVAFTDHSNYFDTTSAANPEGALYDMDLATAYSQQRWKEYKDKIADFNNAQTGVIAIGGFEMTWSGGPGHINTFNTPGIVSRNNSTLNNKTNDAGIKAYYELLSRPEGSSSISQLNHPGTTFGTFSDFAYWDGVIDSRIYMVEVGNGEGQIGAGGYFPSYEYYIMALDKGWHVAPTNNQDNHKGKWGNANDARDVIITDNFTEEGIYEAIRERRMYATEDKNLELGYTVNGSMMGSILSEVPSALDFEVSVSDPDKTDSIAKVEIIANSGRVVHTWSSAAELASGTLSLTLDPNYSYYFVRVTEADGDLAVTSPVWVGDMLKLGISNFVCGTSTPVTGEELTLTTTLFNSEATDATVTALSYTIGGVSIGVDNTGYTLAASSTLDIPFKWTPDKARVTTVTVTAVVKQGNNEYTFTKTVELDVQDAEKLVYIGIDASHYNEYVAGNYKDSMGNFGELASDYSVRTVQLNTSEDLIAACGNPKYKALILTAPSRRLAAAQSDPRTYSADELAAIAAFNTRGGIVILAGWSDNYENYDVIQKNPDIKHMAATQNEVLAALGSSLRIGDDATYDDVRSAADGVDKWRLYFSTYNTENPLTDGVIVDPENPYDKLYTERFSHYGGASIYAVDAAGNPTSALPTTVSPVVYGHATTYSVDVDNDGLGGDKTPKYAYADGDNRLIVMASEQLDGKGMIIVSGAAFMSNFEVQAQLDNGAEKNYSNYRICENLLRMINPITVTPIKVVQAEKDENIKYTVEGIVTSNASGYDKDTAFFDCIYVQDDTAGINCFPVAGNFKIGDKVRITGTTSSYQGERQLAVTDIEKIGEETPVVPTPVTSNQVNDGSVLGSLITVKGQITRVEMADGLVQTIIVKDSNGDECRVFIDGYITTDKDVVNAEVGREITVTGLASYDNTFTLSDGTPIAPRIRIRDRADVVCGDMMEQHSHNFGEWVITKSPTCTDPGQRMRSCDCNEIETEVIQPTGHDYEDGICKNCGSKQSTDVPNTPDKPDDSVKTADGSHVELWIALLCLSLTASGIVLYGRKREE